MEHRKQIIHDNCCCRHKINNNMNHVVLLEFTHTEIPDHIFSSKCIQYLVFSNNLICEIPNKIADMIFLRYIDISNNPLTDINGICKMKNLMKINIDSEGIHDSFLRLYSNNTVLKYNIML